MISPKYGNDYRLDVETLPDGKKKDVKVYIGPYFESDESEAVHKKNRLFLLFSEIIFAVLLILNMTFYTELGKVWYVIVPFAVNVLAAYVFFESVAYFWPVRDKLTREQKERGQDRLKQMSAVQAVLCMISEVAGIITTGFLLASVSINDIVFCTLACVMLLITVSQTLYLRKIDAKEIENPLAKKWEKL